MRKLRDNADWVLFDPADVPDLNDVYGDQFAEVYERYLDTATPVAKIPAYDLWRSICGAQVETGSPFLMYQDNINREPCSSPFDSGLAHWPTNLVGRNNQRHLGPVRSSNLCTEIVQYSSPTSSCCRSDISDDG